MDLKAIGWLNKTKIELALEMAIQMEEENESTTTIYKGNYEF